MTENFSTGPYCELPDSAWHLEPMMIDDSTTRLAYAGFEGAVGILALDGTLHWRVEISGIPLTIATADIDGDGSEELIVGTSDGRTHAFDKCGKRLWSVTSDGQRPQYTVAVANTAQESIILTGGTDCVVRALSPAGEVLATHPVEVVVHRLVTLDADDDGDDELIVIDNRTDLELLNVPSLEQQWRRTLTVPEEMKNWENPSGKLYAFDIAVDDLTGDGRPDLIFGDAYFNKQAVMTTDADLQRLWISDMLSWEVSDEEQYAFYSTAFVDTGEVESDSDPNVFAVAGGHLRQFSADGTLLADAKASIGFSDIAVIDGVAYLGSTPNGDNFIYRVDLNGDWQHDLERLQRQGRAKRMGETLDEISVQAGHISKQADGSPASPNKLRYVERARLTNNFDEVATELAWADERTGQNVKPVAGIKLMEPNPPLDPNGEPWNPQRWEVDAIRGTQSVEELVEIAKTIERREIPTIGIIGHSNMPFISLETAEKLLEAAPNSLIGFRSMEDENPTDLPLYAEHYLGPLADLCKEHDANLFLTNKNVWWFSMPAHPRVHEAIFGENRADVIVPVTEDSNSRTPELNLFARLGLYQAGIVAGHQVSAIYDLFSACRFHQYEYPMHGHPFLRLLLVHTLLGGRHSLLRIRDIYEADAGLSYNRLGREAVEPFFHLLDAGLVETPSPERMAGLSSVGLAVHAPPEEWTRDGHNGHRPNEWQHEMGFDPREAIIPYNGVGWGYTPVPPHALQRVLFDKTMQFGSHIPATPYGPVAIVPATADLQAVPHVEKWWNTDGVAIWKDSGERLTGGAAAHRLERSFETAAMSLPFRPSGDSTFFHTIDHSDGRFRIYAVDPGWQDPQERSIHVTVQRPGRFEIVDALSQNRITIATDRFELTVPAGGFRIVDAVPIGSHDG